jgi:hypothetical protein
MVAVIFEVLFQLESLALNAMIFLSFKRDRNYSLKNKTSLREVTKTEVEYNVPPIQGFGTSAVS